MEEDLPRSAPAKGKRNNIFQVPEQSQDHDIFNYQSSSKKLKVSKPTSSSNTNTDFFYHFRVFYFFENQDESFPIYTV